MRASPPVAARRRREPRPTSTRLPPALALLLILASPFASPSSSRSGVGVADAHFLFARLDDEERNVRVYFSEPVAREGPVIGHIADRLPSMLVVGPNGRREDVALHPAIATGDDADPPGYLWGSLPSGLDNVPYFVTGFLDYGEFGEGDGPKSDLQYTFSAQMSSTSPGDDFSHFFHGVAGTDAASPYFPEGEDDDADEDGKGTETPDPFAVALKNYGPPYRAVVRGVGPQDPVRACLYDGDDDGSDAPLVACVSGTHGGAHHLTFDPVDVGVLKPCGSYFVLANATLEGRNAWSSSSVAWDGPCSPGMASRRRSPDGPWFEPFKFGSFVRGGAGGRGSPAGGDKGGGGGGALRAVALFAAGLVLGAAATRFATTRRGPSGGRHAPVESAEENEGGGGAADFQDVQAEYEIGTA